ncbi:MAG TPA: conjugative transfer signal peptidase TraF [Noviherbaspirillum sp.]
MIVDPATLGPRTKGYGPLLRLCRLLSRMVGDALCHARRHWLVHTLVFAIWGLAFARVFIDPTPHLPILFNWTPSVPYKVAFVQYGTQQRLARGDFIVYRFDGEAQQRYPGLKRQPFFKQIRGVPGDRVTVVGRQVFVNNVAVGFAKATTFDHHPLAPIGATVIPPDCYYVQGTHLDSFDSRYRESGLVRTDQVIGKVIPLF